MVFRIRLDKGGIDLGLIYGGITIFLIFAARVVDQLNLPVYPCPFHALTTLPCPTCGSTRALIHLSRFDFTASLASNPLICLTALAVLIWGTASCILAFRHQIIRPELTGRSRLFLKVSIPSVILLNWLYVVMIGN
ncbi:DUF2752 domain-containing protein [bacterium]|nr:DUF2752 domain-containing protein [candidate division CSSED10-310 bacterium]